MNFKIFVIENCKLYKITNKKLAAILLEIAY